MGNSILLCGCLQNNNEPTEDLIGKIKNNSSIPNNRQQKISSQQNSKNQINNINNIKEQVDKNLCKMIFDSLPKRETTELLQFKEILKNKTNNLYEKDKAYILFLWVCDNIVYDYASYFAGRNVDCEPEGVFRNGKTVCSGYARLYKNLGEYIGLEIQSISCYSKGVGYEPGKKLFSTDHEYNIIKLENTYYPIDCTWGSGTLQGDKYVKKLNEFYFLSDPELLINTHFPANDKWQLTKKKYTLEEFLKWPQIFENFYVYGFNKYFPEDGMIELESNMQKFTIWGNDISQNNASCSIYLLEGNVYQQQLNLDKISFYQDRIEFDFIFNRKGRYKIYLFGNNDKGKITHNIMTYIVNVHNNNLNELKFPYSYSDAKDINIIEPLYDNIKSGQRVKFKIKTDLEELDTLIIIDGQWHYLNKDEHGFFEKEIVIQTPPGKNIVIGKRKDNNDCSCSYLVAYTIK